MDKSIGTDSCDFLTAPEMDVDDFLALSSSRLDIYDLDSVSQISAMDSASQTGSVILESQQTRPSRPIFSSDSNIHRSLAENGYVYLYKKYALKKLDLFMLNISSHRFSAIVLTPFHAPGSNFSTFYWLIRFSSKYPG